MIGYIEYKIRYHIRRNPGRPEDPMMISPIFLVRWISSDGWVVGSYQGNSGTRLVGHLTVTSSLVTDNRPGNKMQTLGLTQKILH